MKEKEGKRERRKEGEKEGEREREKGEREGESVCYFYCLYIHAPADYLFQKLSTVSSVHA